jgi:hypothetical protein
MRESRPYGSVRGALNNERPYRDPLIPPMPSRWVACYNAYGKREMQTCRQIPLLDNVSFVAKAVTFASLPVATSEQAVTGWYHN